MQKGYDSLVEKQFADHLVSIGFPKDSIIYEPVFIATDGQRKYRPDFLIIDPVKKEKLAVIEVKAAHLVDSENTYKQLSAFAETVRDEKIPVFLVAPSNDHNSPFSLYTLGENDKLIRSEFSLFPSFRALVAGDSTERKTELRSEKKKTMETFQKVSWTLALVVFAIVVADFVCAQNEILFLTPERIVLIGAAVALIVIPFAQKFKGLGIEFEREIKRDEDR